MSVRVLVLLALLSGVSCERDGHRALQLRQDALEWVRAHAAPLDGVDPERGSADLDALRDWIGGARIVGLGEPTHGSREVFQMKHRIAAYLARELGFSVFSIEASLPDAAGVDDYVRTGEGDPVERIGGMRFWIWNTSELLDLVQWLRRYRIEEGGQLEFTGFDMQFPAPAVRVVRDYVALHAPQVSASVLEDYDTLRSADEFRAATGRARLTLPGRAAAGRSLRLSVWLRSEPPLGLGARAGAVAWAYSGERPIARARLLPSTGSWERGWERRELVLDVPGEVERFQISLWARGAGPVCFDDLQIAFGPERDAAGEGVDLDFENGLAGFELEDRRYRIRAAPVPEARSGARALCIERVEPEKDLPDAARTRERAGRIASRLRDWGESTGRSGDPRFEWALQNARVAEQALALRADPRPSVRDRAMAENVRWLLERDPEARIVLWAHNVHVERRTGAMGEHLARWYGDLYRPIAFSTGRGEYSAIDPERGPRAHPLQEPVLHSVEALLRDVALPHFALDLRAVRASAEAGPWFAAARPFRTVGSYALEQQFSRRRVAESFDVLVHLEHTTASQLLP